MLPDIIIIACDLSVFAVAVIPCMFWIVCSRYASSPVT